MCKVGSEIRTVKRQLMLEEWEKQVIDCRSSGLTALIPESLMYGVEIGSTSLSCSTTAVLSEK